MTAPAPTPGQSCGCPERDGKIYHQRGTCTDPVVAKLDWYADAGRIAAAPEPEQAHEDGPYAGLSPYGIAVTALERILGLDDGERDWDAMRAIASEAAALAVAAGTDAQEPQPAPELARIRAELHEVGLEHAQLIEVILANADDDFKDAEEAPGYVAEAYVRWLEGEVGRLKAAQEPQPAAASASQVRRHEAQAAPGLAAAMAPDRALLDAFWAAYQAHGGLPRGTAGDVVDEKSRAALTAGVRAVAAAQLPPNPTVDEIALTAEADRYRGALTALRSGILGLAADLDHSAAGTRDHGDAEIMREFAAALRRLLETPAGEVQPELAAVTAERDSLRELVREIIDNVTPRSATTTFAVISLIAGWRERAGLETP